MLAYAQPVTVRSRDLAHLSDEALVALVSRSDESALAELYDRVGGIAYGLAYRILRDESLAEDAVQEAFLGLWRSAGSFIPERAKASTWILTLVHRRAVDLVRREQRRRAEPLEGAPEPSEGSAEEAAWLRLDRARVQTALAELPDQQREAIELAYYGGYTQSELAERLGQPLGTIKSRMFSGLVAPARASGRRCGEEFMDVHELTAGYALDALDPAERETYEEHLSSCERCRDELQGFWQVSGALAHAAGGPMPPASLRGPDPRAGAQRAVERRAAAAGASLVPRCPSVAAVAAVAAIGLGIWATSLSRDLDRCRDASSQCSATRTRASSRATSGEASLVVDAERRGRARRAAARRPPLRARTTRSGSSRTACRSARGSSRGRVSRC